MTNGQPMQWVHPTSRILIPTKHVPTRVNYYTCGHIGTIYRVRHKEVAPLNTEQESVTTNIIELNICTTMSKV